MKTFLQPLMLLVLYVLVRSAEKVFGPVLPKVFWTICYIFVFVFALLIIVLTVLGL